jgi:hypothetical protein
MNAKDKLIKARTQLVLDQPFFGSLALRLVLVEDDPGCYCVHQWSGFRI